MHRSKILVGFIFLVGCTRPPSTVKARLTTGERLYSFRGTCNTPLNQSSTAIGYFEFEGDKVLAVTTGACKSKVSFSAVWLHANRVQLTRPVVRESCGSPPALDSTTSIILTFEDAGADIKLFSSLSADCRLMKWRNG